MRLYKTKDKPSFAPLYGASEGQGDPMAKEPKEWTRSDTDRLMLQMLGLEMYAEPAEIIPETSADESDEDCGWPVVAFNPKPTSGG